MYSTQAVSLFFLRCKKWSKVIALFVSTFETMFAKSRLDPGRLSQSVREGRAGGAANVGGELARQFLKRFRKKMRRLGTSQHHSRTQHGSSFPKWPLGRGTHRRRIYFFFGGEGRGEEKFTGSYTEVNPVVATIFYSIIEKIGRSRKKSL